MIKKIKFPLAMRDNYQARNIDELREYFDISKALEYLLDGKLKTWLEDRYYMVEAENISKLDPYDKNVKEELCHILGVEMEIASEQVEVGDIERRKERLNLLKQYTDDELMWTKVDYVAFNQEELADMLDEGVKEIYLCGSNFQVPYFIKDVKYIGIGEVSVCINSSETVYEKDIEGMFENISILNEVVIIEPVVDKALDYLWGRNGKELNIKAGFDILANGILDGNEEACACMFYEIFNIYEGAHHNPIFEIDFATKKYIYELCWDKYYEDTYNPDNGIYSLISCNKDYVLDKLYNNDYVRCCERFIELGSYVNIKCKMNTLFDKKERIKEMAIRGYKSKSVFCAWILSEMEYDLSQKEHYLHKAVEYCSCGVPKGMQVVLFIAKSLLENGEEMDYILEFLEREAEKYYHFDPDNVFYAYKFLALLFSNYKWTDRYDDITYYYYELNYSELVNYDYEKAVYYAKKALQIGEFIMKMHPKDSTDREVIYDRYCDDIMCFHVLRDIATYGMSSKSPADY